MLAETHDGAVRVSVVTQLGVVSPMAMRFAAAWKAAM
jgi:hypothetical protein